MLHILAILIFAAAGLFALAVIADSIAASADKIARALTTPSQVPPLARPVAGRVRITRLRAMPVRAAMRAAA